MVEIKVQFSVLDDLSGRKRSMSTKAENTRQRLDSLRRSLDWEVGRSYSIDRNLSDICSDIEGYAETLLEMSQYLKDASREYRRCENEIANGSLVDNISAYFHDAIESLLNTTGGTSNAVNQGVDKPVSYGKYNMGEPTRPAWEEGKQYDEGFKYNPNAKATFDDYKNWAVWGTKAVGADVVSDLSMGAFNLKDAVEAYEHYRSGKGTDLTIDYEKAYKEDEYIRNTVNKYIADAQKTAQELYKLSGQNSFKMTGKLLPVGSDGYPVTENWQKAIGAHLIWISADVSVDSSGQFKMVTTVHEIDRYNFNKGMSDIATGTPDDVNGRFSELGWAKSFNTVGQMTRDVTWINGNIEDSTTMKVPKGRR